MKTRRILLTLPLVVTVVAIAATQNEAHAQDASVATDAGVTDAADEAGDAGDRHPTGCGAMAPPNGAVAFGAGCC
jgi:hypothetical protein